MGKGQALLAEAVRAREMWDEPVEQGRRCDAREQGKVEMQLLQLTGHVDVDVSPSHVILDLLSE